MIKRVLLCVLVFSTLFLPVSSAADRSVVTSGFGETVEQALEKALSEAVAAVAGGIFAERSTLSGEDLKERFLRYSRGTVETYTVLEEKELELEKGFSVTVQAVVDIAALRERATEFMQSFRADLPSSEGSQGGLIKTVDSLVEQIRSCRFEDFLAPEIVAAKRDEKTRTISFSLRIAFDADAYRDGFAWGVSFLLERIVSEPEFSALLFPEEGGKGVPAATFHVLDENQVSRSYTLPVEIANRLADALGFSVKSDPRGAAFRRAWLHLDLLDGEGASLERIPVALPLTNVGAFFLRKSAEAAVERVAGQLASASKRVAVARTLDEVFLVQAFGRALPSGGAEFMTDSVQQMKLELPEELFSRTKSIAATLRLEKW
ncbi:MAG: hypothetical protein QM441_05395 [Synergistota bacterium]|jgi:hypothetical protein|nr:hypothetical protein [Synergistota bacterium]OPZ38767.1 MAG: hypothetical protein BWY99_01543 [Synergistetes bacterium ADurb.BinA166]